MRKASFFPISFIRLSVHCQSPELQQPARAGKVGASGPQAQRHGTDFTDRFPKIAADAVENLGVRSCVLDDGCSGRKARSMDDKKNRISAPPIFGCLGGDVDGLAEILRWPIEADDWRAGGRLAFCQSEITLGAAAFNPLRR